MVVIALDFIIRSVLIFFFLNLHGIWQFHFSFFWQTEEREEIIAKE